MASTYEGQISNATLTGPISLGIRVPQYEYPSGVLRLGNIGSGESSARWMCQGGESGKSYTFGLYLVKNQNGTRYQIGTVTIGGNGGYAYTSVFSLPHCRAIENSYVYLGSSMVDGAMLKLIGTATVSITTQDVIYNVSIKANGYGSISADRLSGKPGTTVTLNVTPGVNARFTGFTKNPANLIISNNTFTMPNQSVSITANFTSYKGASAFSANDVEFGSESTVKLSNSYISIYKHYITWQIDSDHSYSMWTETGATSASFTIPTAWMETTPNAEQITLTISVDTYEGETKIGDTVTKSVLAIVPDSVVPTAGTFNINPYIVLYDNQQPVTITPSGYQPGAYATITSYTLLVNPSEEYTYSDGVFTIPNCGKSGAHHVQVGVVDSRGRTNNTSWAAGTFTVVPHTPPAILSCTAERCLTDGTPDEYGTYALVSGSVNLDELEGDGYDYNNTMFVYIRYYKASDPNNKYTGYTYRRWNTDLTFSNVIGGGDITVTDTWYIEIEAVDAYSGRDIKTIQVLSSPFSIHVKTGGRGVAFGKASEYSDAVEINPTWDLYYKGKILTDPAVMTGATAQTAGTSGLTPAPAAGDQEKYLRGDGTWQPITIPEVDPPTVLRCDLGTISSLPVTLAFADVTSDMTVIAYEVGTPKAFASRLDITTSDGSVTVSGTMATSGSSTVKLTLCNTNEVSPDATGE